MRVSIHHNIDILAHLEAIFADFSFFPGKQVIVKPNLCGREPVK